MATICVRFAIYLLDNSIRFCHCYRMKNQRLTTIIKVRALTPHTMQFKELGRDYRGYQKIFSFPNGYGASVVCHIYAYGNSNGGDFLELALLDENENMTQHNEITNDVIGHLVPSECNDWLEKIAKLPKKVLTSAT